MLDSAKTGGVEIEQMRGLWAELQNRALERAGEAELGARFLRAVLNLVAAATQGRAFRAVLAAERGVRGEDDPVLVHDSGRGLVATDDSSEKSVSVFARPTHTTPLDDTGLTMFNMLQQPVCRACKALVIHRSRANSLS